MIKRAITVITICAAIAGGATSFSARAATGADLSPQEVKQNQVKEIKSLAEMHYVRGEQAYQNGEYNQARREFDEAVDIIINRIGSIDIQSDDDLRAYYRSLIERINRYQIAALEQKDGGFNEQRFEPSPLDKIASLSDADLEEITGVDNADVMVNARFNFKFTTSHTVNQFINYFTKGRGRSTMEAGLYRSSRYRAMAESVFKTEGVPTDLIWLAQVESGWNPYAMSWAAARGIWQFIPSTGVRFGLTQNYWVDERSNPEKSTRAAAKYLKWLADRYKGDWMLALAAYNTGEGNIDSAIARSGSRDFWQIHRGGYIARETRNYVPAILAVVTIAKTPKKFGFEMPPTYPVRFETRMVAAQTDLRPLAKKLKISYGALLDLNPELQRGITPPGKHVIRIPASLITKAAPMTEASESMTNNE